ncbi:MAG: PAS domain-containing protein [Sulfuritalea sp.]|nr:PAS domain-containing protein [Sulfuritalea sp.]
MDATLQALTVPRQASLPNWEQPPTLTIDSDGTILHASDGAARFFEYPSGYLAGMYISELVPALTDIEVPGDKNVELVRYLSRCGVSFTAHSGKNRDFPCHLSIVALHDSRNGSYRVVFTRPESRELAEAIYSSKN